MQANEENEKNEEKGCTEEKKKEQKTQIKLVCVLFSCLCFFYRDQGGGGMCSVSPAPSSLAPLSRPPP